MDRNTIDSHDIIKLLEFAFSRDFFTWKDLKEIYPNIKLEWYVSGTPHKDLLLIEAGHDDSGLPLHRISPNGLAIYLNHANLLEAQRTAKRAERLAWVAVFVAVASVVIQIVVSLD